MSEFNGNSQFNADGKAARDRLMQRGSAAQTDVVAQLIAEGHGKDAVRAALRWCRQAWKIQRDAGAKDMATRPRIW